ncbi:hypothetical protein E2C01_002370 [Portunus trituberculatus]|uniref:Uncharacterized protein n=1 Tax=Portunus trituberculatus TaxID=210409 RepID=A0A5B7CJ76_PORTR|nr:hypothetical protein [Portunus trituberculatus]
MTRFHIHSGYYLQFRPALPSCSWSAWFCISGRVCSSISSRVLKVFRRPSSSITVDSWDMHTPMFSCNKGKACTGGYRLECGIASLRHIHLGDAQRRPEVGVRVT